jgi:hypothetical protein
MKGVRFMKKNNKAMRAAGGLLVATLLSTSIVSGTYAKYVSKGSSNDIARAAKWGVAFSGSGSLFGTNYYKHMMTGDPETPESLELDPDSDLPSVETASSDDRLSVVSYNGCLVGTPDGGVDKVVAPGTKNDTGLTLAISGQPEVDTRLAATIEFQDLGLKGGTSDGESTTSYSYNLMRKVQFDSQAEFDAKILSENGLYTGDFKKITRTETTDDVSGETTVTYTDSNNDTVYFYTNTDYYEFVFDPSEISIGTDGYYPVKYYYTHGDAEEPSTTAVKLSEIADDIAGAFFSNYTKEFVDEASDTGTGKVGYVERFTGYEDYEANTDFGDALNIGTITWKWDYNTPNSGDYYDSETWNETDYRDTILGDLAALYTDEDFRNSSYYTNDDYDGYVIVWFEGTSSGFTLPNAVTPLFVNDEGFIMKCDDSTYTATFEDDELIDNSLGSLRAVFNIDITATQID